MPKHLYVICGLPLTDGNFFVTKIPQFNAGEIGEWREAIETFFKDLPVLRFKAHPLGFYFSHFCNLSSQKVLTTFHLISFKQAGCYSFV